MAQTREKGNSVSNFEKSGQVLILRSGRDMAGQVEWGDHAKRKTTYTRCVSELICCGDWVTAMGSRLASEPEEELRRWLPRAKIIYSVREPQLTLR